MLVHAAACMLLVPAYQKRRDRASAATALFAWTHIAGCAELQKEGGDESAQRHREEAEVEVMLIERRASHAQRHVDAVAQYEVTPCHHHAGADVVHG